jgi:hypothetical protein
MMCGNIPKETLNALEKKSPKNDRNPSRISEKT